jgi:predicted DNA-binding transcriptional regulator AlpA
MDPLTRDQLLNLPTVVNLPTAARALGIGRTKAYELAQRRQFPCRVLRVGHSYHVPTAGLLELLGISHLHEHTPDHQEETAPPRQ